MENEYFDDTNLVRTLHGFLPKKEVISLDVNEKITLSNNNHVIVIDSMTGKLIKDYGPADFNTFNENPSQRAYNIRKKHSIKQEYEYIPPTTETIFPNTPYELPSFFAKASVTGLKTFSATWKVPSPKENLTDSSEPDTWLGINGGAVQPIVGWIPTNGGGYYIIQNIATQFGKYTGSKVVRVETGQTITSTITYTGYRLVTENGRSAGYHFLMQFEGYPQLDYTAVLPNDTYDVVICYEPYAVSVESNPTNGVTHMTNLKATFREGYPVPPRFLWTPGGPSPIPNPSGKYLTVTNDSTVDGNIDVHFK